MKKHLPLHPVAEYCQDLYKRLLRITIVMLIAGVAVFFFSRVASMMLIGMGFCTMVMSFHHYRTSKTFVIPPKKETKP